MTYPPMKTKYSSVQMQVLTPIFLEDENFTESVDHCENICHIIQNITKMKYVS